MGEFRELSRLVSTDLGPHVLPQQSTDEYHLPRYEANVLDLRCEPSDSRGLRSLKTIRLRYVYYRSRIHIASPLSRASVTPLLKLFTALEPTPQVLHGG
jgi:hypothetical protein